jgi:hypothetical protein
MLHVICASPMSITYDILISTIVIACPLAHRKATCMLQDRVARHGISIETSLSAPAMSEIIGYEARSLGVPVSK